MLSFYLFKKYLFSKKSISLVRTISYISFSSLVLSLCSIILITSIMGGFGNKIKEDLLKKESHLIIKLKKKPSKKELSYIFNQIPLKLKNNIKSYENFENQDLILKTKDHFVALIGKGYPSSVLKKKLSLYAIDDFYMQNLKPSSLSNSTLSNSLEKNIPIALDYNFSRHFKLKLEDDLILSPLISLLLPSTDIFLFKTAKLKHIIERIERKSSYQQQLLYRMGDLNFLPYSQINHGIEIKLKNPEKYLSYKKIFSDYEIETWADRNSSLFFALKLEKFIMLIFVFLAFIISCLGISSALFLLIVQKKRDIGILKAMGLSSKKITNIFTQIGFFLSLLGISVGSFFGVLGSFLLKYNKFNILPAIYEHRTIPTLFLPQSYLIIVFIALIIATISCYLPSFYFSQMQISKLLKSVQR